MLRRCRSLQPAGQLERCVREHDVRTRADDGRDSLAERCLTVDPAALRGRGTASKKRDVESALREAGLSRAEAKRVAALAASTLTPEPRDASDEEQDVTTDLQALLRSLAA